MQRLFHLLLYFIFSSSHASESEDYILTTVNVKDNIWAITGPLGNRTALNYGNNASFGFIVSKQGVVVIDPGGSYLGAEKIHNIIKSVTAQPIRYVINTGSQDHRWLGNDYFSQQGAKIISSKAAFLAQKKNLKKQIARIKNTAGSDILNRTTFKHADIIFDNNYKLTLDDIQLELYYNGPAHTAGDIYIWIPQSKVIFSGDIVYTQRMLRVAEHSNSKNWISVFNTMSRHSAEHLIPGHGQPTTLIKARQDTLNYLVFLRNSVQKFIDNDQDISDIDSIKQTDFSYLINFKQLSKRNIQQVYQEIEWE